MGKATRPVSVAGIEFDALISSDHKLEATVPEYTTESGFVVSDTIILGQEKLDMTLYLTDTPVTWYRRHGANNGRVKSVCAKLEQLYYSATPVTVVTSDRTYTNMAIESITISKSTQEGYSREIPISFRKIRTTAAKTTTIPSSYGKSGPSNTSAGTASTSTAAAPAVPDTTASSGDGSGSNSSILYSAGSSLGVIG